jgi:hypothetical protein
MNRLNVNWWAMMPTPPGINPALGVNIMSHEILQTQDGTFAMAYRAGDPVPWHAPETDPQTFEPGAAPEIILDAARLNYEVDLFPNCRPTGEAIEDSFHIARTDGDREVFGRFVAGDWQPVQNANLMSLAHEIETRHGFQVITAGALFGGSKVFVQLETGRSFTLPGNDKVVNRLLCTVSHVGNESNQFVGGKTRAVCHNTVNAVLSEGAGIITHDHRVAFDHDAIVTAIGLNADDFDAFATAAQAMAVAALSDAQALEYFRTVLGGRERTDDNSRVIYSQAVGRAQAFHQGRDFVAIGQKSADDVARIVSEKLDDIGRNVRNGELPDDIAKPSETINPGHDMDSARGTIWGALNTVTYMADHNPTKKTGTDNALASNLLGTGSNGKLKQRAWAQAVKLLQPAAAA